MLQLKSKKIDKLKKISNVFEFRIDILKSVERVTMGSLNLKNVISHTVKAFALGLIFCTTPLKASDNDQIFPENDEAKRLKINSVQPVVTQDQDPAVPIDDPYEIRFDVFLKKMPEKLQGLTYQMLYPKRHIWLLTYFAKALDASNETVVNTLSHFFKPICPELELKDEILFLYRVNGFKNRQKDIGLSPTFMHTCKVLSEGQISSCGRVFAGYYSDKGLSMLPASLKIWAGVTELFLSKNHLADIRPLSQLVLLEELYLAENGITELKPLATLTGLKKLYLNDNNIENLEPLSPLVNLTHLELSHNSISKLGPLRGLGKNLQELGLSHNLIEDIRALGELKALKGANLSHNKIRDVGALSLLPNIKHINIDHKVIEDFGPLNSWQDIGNFSFAHNKLKDVSDLRFFKSIDSLTLSENPIKELPISHLVMLTNLRLVHTSITNFDFLKHLINLSAIDFSHTSFKDIKTLGDIKTLMHVYLFFTQVADVEALTHLPKLYELYLFGSPVVDTPEKITHVQGLFPKKITLQLLKESEFGCLRGTKK